MVYWVLGFALGIQFLQYLKHLPSVTLLILLMLVAFSFWLWVFLSERHRNKKPLWQNYALMILAFSLGLAWTTYHAYNLLRWKLPTNLIAKTVDVTGRIVAINKKNSLGENFEFLAESLQNQPNQPNQPIHVHFRLGWYGEHPPLWVGDRWQLSVRLKPPHGLHNPGGFNYEHWLFQEGIRATGYVVGNTSHRLPAQSRWSDHLNLIRQKIQNQIVSSIKNPDLAAIISALTVGSRTTITDEQWKVFQATGTNHLVVIAGLHIGFVATIAYFLMSYIVRFFPKLLLRIPAPHLAVIAALIASWCYGLLAGLPIPTQRALIMLTSFMLAKLFYRTTPVWRRLLLAFGIIIALEPMAMSSASFWLSFAAVGSIGYGLGGRINRGGELRQWSRIQWVVCLGLMSLTLWYFQCLSWVMLLANAIAIPWVGFIIEPISLLGCLSYSISSSLSHYVFVLASLFLQPLWWWLKWLSHFPLAVWNHAISSPWILLTSLVGASLILSPKGFPGRWLGVIWIMPLFLYRPAQPPLGSVWLTLLDVGQGLSALVQTSHHVLLFDAGPKSQNGFDAGEQIVIPSMRYLHLSHLDKMIISHGDNDHIGGAFAVLNHYTVDELLTSVPERFQHNLAVPDISSVQGKGMMQGLLSFGTQIVKSEGMTQGSLSPGTPGERDRVRGRWHSKVTINFCRAGQTWIWDNVEFTILYPESGFKYEGNNSSCVLRISAGAGSAVAGKSSLLLTGDIEKPAEESLLQNHRADLASLVLVVPHHGSKTSSTEDFIKAVAPQYALFPLGYYNRYHFPSAIVWERYQGIHARLLTSANDGAIYLKMSPNGDINVATENRFRYYWQDKGL